MSDAPETVDQLIVLNKDEDTVFFVDAFEEIDRFDAGVHPDGIASLER